MADFGGAGLIGAGKYLGALGRKVDATRRAMEAFPEREATRLETEIKKGIASQAPGGVAFAALAAATIAARRRKGRHGTKILIDTNAMREAVTHQGVARGVWFVGLLRTQAHKGPDGTITMANLGYIHEVVGVKAGKGGKRRIRRPFIEPTFLEYRKGARDRFIRDVGAPWRGR